MLTPCTEHKSKLNAKSLLTQKKEGVNLISRILSKFKSKPTLYYAMSIAASWAGAGSLMNSTTLANTLGVIPALIWALFNTLACIVFGVLIWYLPTVRRIMRTKACRMLLAIFSNFPDMALHDCGQRCVERYCRQTSLRCLRRMWFRIAFIIALYKRGIIANILTDNGGMYVIYLLVAVLSGVSLIASKGDFI